MKIKISDHESQTAGFITWRRLATQLFRDGGELRTDEAVTHFEVGEHGINYFVSKLSQPAALAGEK